MSEKPVKAKGRDLYLILGLDKSANQGQIKHAYRKLAIKYHPDKNLGDEEAAEKFKQVSTAYAILSDPNKKRQYDLHGDDGDSLPEFSTINVEDLGTMGRLFGALISKAGIPVPTDIDRKVLAAAEHISRGETNIPGFPVPEPTVLQYGQVVNNAVERQAAHFYKLTVSETDLKTGVVVSCRSNSRDKFKLVFFDTSGHVAMVEESQKMKKQSQANLYSVPFGRYNMSETMPLNVMKHLDEDVPPVFMILDTFDKDVRTHLSAGTHLFCVYGDNWFQSAKYTLRCLVAVDRHSQCVETIQATEEKMAKKKSELEGFQSEFSEIKRKYDEAMKRLEGDVNEIGELIQQRDSAYNEYMEKSAQKYIPPTLVPQQGSQKEGKGGSLFGKFFG